MNTWPPKDRTPRSLDLSLKDLLRMCLLVLFALGLPVLILVLGQATLATSDMYCLDCCASRSLTTFEIFGKRYLHRGNWSEPRLGSLGVRYPEHEHGEAYRFVNQEEWAFWPRESGSYSVSGTTDRSIQEFRRLNYAFIYYIGTQREGVSFSSAEYEAIRDGTVLLSERWPQYLKYLREPLESRILAEPGSPRDGSSR